MLYFQRIDVSEGTDINKASLSKGCNICLFWYFLNKGLNVQPNFCNECHNLLTMFISLSDIAILSIKSAGFHCITSGISHKRQ